MCNPLLQWIGWHIIGNCLYDAPIQIIEVFWCVGCACSYTLPIFFLSFFRGYETMEKIMITVLLIHWFVPNLTIIWDNLLSYQEIHLIYQYLNVCQQTNSSFELEILLICRLDCYPATLPPSIYSTMYSRTCYQPDQINHVW